MSDDVRHGTARINRVRDRSKDAKVTHLKRAKNLVTRVDETELAMAHALAEALDEPMTRIVRRLLRDAYVSRFGVTPPKKAITK